METLKVKAIENGTVIDHIPADSLFKIIHILDLDKITDPVTFGNNLESKRMGKKAIIKIDNHFCEDDEINKISIVAPRARVNTIRNYEVVEKRHVQVPDYIEGIVRCGNPACITNHERIRTKFDVRIRDGQIALRCCYCEKVTGHESVRIIK